MAKGNTCHDFSFACDQLDKFFDTIFDFHHFILLQFDLVGQRFLLWSISWLIYTSYRWILRSNRILDFADRSITRRLVSTLSA